MVMVLLVDLPDVILKHLQSFLSKDDIQYFVNSNKAHLGSLKQETIYFSLNKEKSLEYVKDERFREMLLSKVKDGNKQIGLKIDQRLPDFYDVVAHKIDISRDHTHLLQNVSSQYVYLFSTKIEEIPFIPKLQDLELYNCTNIEDFSNLSHLNSLKLSEATHLTDITPLQNIPHLTFTKCPNIQDFSKLTSKRQLFVSIHQSTISNVSFLRDILTVRLHHCHQLVDVSPLYGIKSLRLTSCYGIRDISCLGNHHELMIFDCRSVERGYECFRTVRHAVVSQSEIPDLRVFQEVKSLQITFYSSMESQLSLLKDIPDLILIPCLFNKRKEVYDISHVRSIRLALYDDVINIKNGKFPSQLRYLMLTNCQQIVKIINEGNPSIFQHLQSLHITKSSIDHVNGLGDIPTIILENCFLLHDISALGRNRCVELDDCPNIHDVSSLVTVPIVTIRNCEEIVDFSCLSSVPRLKIVSGY